MGSIDDLSEVQMANLCLLTAIRDCGLKSVVEACCRFGIAEDLAQLVTALSHPQMFLIIANLGNECLFLPRQNLAQLLTLPLPLLGPAFAAHPPRPAPLPAAGDTRGPASDGAPSAHTTSPAA